MNAIKPLARTRDTITLKRADFDALVRSVEDAVDLAAVEGHRAYEDRVGWETARRNYLTADEARRLLDGESPVRVWREKRGIQQRALAEAAEVAVSYLSEIEGGKKPGSPGALRRIASVLEVPMETLTGMHIAEVGLKPVNQAEMAAERLAAAAASTGATRDRLTDEARVVVAEWMEIAGRDGGRNRVGAALQALALCLREISSDWRHRSIELDQNGDKRAAMRMRSELDTLESAIDVVREEYRKR
jgi:transcriptional regulator with XRE-family HTH domain